MPAQLESKYLEDRTGISDTDTTPASLKGMPPISAIDVEVRATNGATSNTLQGLDLDIDTIEVIDGGTVITSLSASQLLGIHFYQNMTMPRTSYDEGAAAVQVMSVRLSFGRWLGDPDYYLDPGVFANPQIRVINTLTISATAGYATGTGDLTYIAHVLKSGARTRKGTIRVREFKEFTSLASGEDRTEIDTKEILRRIYVRAREAAIAFETDITAFRLEDGKRNRLTDNIRTDHWFAIVRGRYPQAVFNKRLLRADNATPTQIIQTIEELEISSAFAARNALVDAIAGDQVTIDLNDLATPTADATARALRLITRGHAPWATLPWDFGWPSDPDTWYDASALDKLEVVLTQGGADATVQVMAESVMK